MLPKQPYAGVGAPAVATDRSMTRMGYPRFFSALAPPILAVLVAACGATGAAGKRPGAVAEVKDDGAAPGGNSSCKRRGSHALPQRISTAGGTVALAEKDDTLVAFVADEDERAVHVIDVDGRQHLSTTPLDGRPAALHILADGRVAVALRDTSKIAVLEPKEALGEAMAVRCQVAAPAEPVALASSPDGGSVYALSGWGKSLAVLDGAELKTTATIAIARSARGLALSADGATAFVSHAAGGKLTVVDLAKHGVRQVSLAARHDQEIDELRNRIAAEVGKTTGALSADELAKLSATMDLADKLALNGGDFDPRRTSCQGFALAQSGTRVYAPQVLVDPGDRGRRTAGYGEENVNTEVPSIAVVDARVGYPIANSLRVNQDHMFQRRDDEEHCILPRAAAVDPKSDTLLVGCMGSDLVIAYDALAPDPARTERQRWRVSAGPSGIAVDPDEARAVVWSQFDRVLDVLPLGGELELSEGDDDRRVTHIEVPSSPERALSTEELLGRVLFHSSGDGRISSDGRACASCHPEGHDDGLVWATPNGPRRTKMLAGAIEGTAPYAWDGGASSLEEHLRATFVRLNGAGGVRSVEFRALAAYLRALPAPPAALADNAALAKRGEEIFESKRAGCRSCHSGEGYTDNEVHDVKSATRVDRESEFNTPSLRFLGGRAPYFHDGRYPTLRELLTQTDGSMGHTKHLEADDLVALEAFLGTL
jgi:DNA-binding beta-propeller fold protein YncE